MPGPTARLSTSHGRTIGESFRAASHRRCGERTKHSRGHNSVTFGRQHRDRLRASARNCNRGDNNEEDQSHTVRCTSREPARPREPNATHTPSPAHADVNARCAARCPVRRPRTPTDTPKHGTSAGKLDARKQYRDHTTRTSLSTRARPTGTIEHDAITI